MNDQIWYIYQNKQQLGPFATAQVSQMFSSQMIASDAYAFKVGWKDWRPIEECYEELGFSRPQPPVSAHRKESAPRATIRGRIVVHNNGQLIIGSGVNISSSGIFVETKDQIFKVGDKLKLSVRIDGLPKAFNAVAHVIRYNADARYPIGFGLRFENLEPQVGVEIDRFVALQEQPARQKPEAS